MDQLFDEWWLWREFRTGIRGGWFGAGFGRQEFGDDLEVVEHLAGAIDVEVVRRDAAKQMRGDDQGGGAVLNDGQEEWFL